MTVKKRVRTPDKFNTRMLLTIYDMVKAGANDSKIAGVLGIQRKTLYIWRRDREEVRQAYKEAKAKQVNNTTTFKDFVYNRLSKRLQLAWQELSACEREQNPHKRIEALFRRKGVRVRQQLFVHALVDSNFNPSLACRKVNISKSTLDDWVAKDPEFSDLLAEIDWHKGNYFEGKLIGLCEAGESSAILFANRTFNARRGYGNKTEVVHSGGVNNVHAMIDVDDLDLPLEVRKAMLRKLRERDTVMKALPAGRNDDVEDAEYEVQEDE